MKKKEEDGENNHMNIRREDLQGAYSEGEALAIYREAKATNDFVGFARRYVHDEDYHVARNALWGLTKATDKELAQLLPLRDELIELAMTTENSSVRRLAMNVIVRLPMEEDEVRTDFLDFCLAHATDVAEYPGIQSLAIKLAWRMCAFYPELMGEFIRMLKAMEMDYYKPAVRSIRNRILNGKYKGECVR